MAKMFYTLEEAAAKLGVSEDRIKDMAGEGQLQQFRDRDNLMFKRDQVDSMANTTDLDESADASGGGMSLADSTAETFELADSSAGVDAAADDSGLQGMSIFEEEDDVSEADPLAGTQVSGGGLDEDDDLQLEQVGSSSGSGLLDLTNESDDTSLGAELLDEIYPGGGSPGDTSLQTTADSGIFGSSGSSVEPAMTVADEESGGLSDLGEVSSMEASAPMEALAPASSGGGTAADGFFGGSLIGVAAVLIIALFVVLPAWSGSPSLVTESMVSSPMYFWIWVGGMFVVWLVTGILGMIVGGRG